MESSSIKSLKIFLGLFLGVVVGQFLYDSSWNANLPGDAHQNYFWLGLFYFFGFDVFLALLKMLILPLIICSVIVAVSGAKDLGKLGKLGTWTFLYYMVTMFIAVAGGLLFVSLIQPGSSIDSSMLPQVTNEAVSASARETAGGGILGVFKNLLGLLLPTNIFEAMSQGKTLSVIVFALFFGVSLNMVGSSSKAVVDFFKGANQALMKMINLVMYLAPLGVFSMLAWAIARIGLGVFTDAIGSYMLTVIIGLSVHAFLVLPVILWVFTKSNPFSYLSAMKPALLTAVGTDSSIATLPVTIECAKKGGGVSEEVSGLVLPLGANLNMDGTALYEAVAVVFLTQAYGIDLTFSQLIIVAITATLAAIGAAGIPSAGLVTMLIVIEAVNDSFAASGTEAILLPLSATALIIGVDRILDMLRTAVNVWGDAVGALIIDRKFSHVVSSVSKSS